MSADVILHLKDLMSQYKFEATIFESVFILKSRFDIWKIFYDPQQTKIMVYHKNKGNDFYHFQKSYMTGKSMLNCVFKDIKDHDNYVLNNRNVKGR